jgi:ABC-2 type transport system permease protein
VSRSLGRTAWLNYTLAAVLAGFQFALMAAAVSLEEGGDFQRLLEAVPAFVREAIGPALGSFAGMAVLAYFEPAILLGLTFFAAYVASEPAGDVETGIVDLVLARPLGRHRLMTRSLIVAVGLTLAMVAVLGSTNWLALTLMAPAGALWPEPRIIGLMMVHVAALMSCFGGLSLAVAAFSERRASAVGVMAMAIVVSYMIHAIEEFSTRLDGIGWFSPFHYFQGTAVLDGTVPTARNMTVLLGVGTVAVVTAYVRFSRRDL